MTLVQVPWQPSLMVHKDLLARLRAVEAAMGRPPMLFGPNSAWRSYAQQKAMWDAYQNGTGNVASNPDTGNRTHMRGVAADLQDTSLAMQRACVRAGLQRDRKENWHWQLLSWANYPIIPEIPQEETDTNMPILVSLVQGNPPQHVGDYAIIGDGGVVGLQAQRDADLINTAKRAMWEREPVYGTQADQLGALFARVAVKPEIDYAKLAAELAKVVKVPTAAENAAATDAALKDDFAAVNTNINKPRTLQ